MVIGGCQTAERDSKSVQRNLSESMASDYCETAKEFIVINEFLKKQDFYESNWAKSTSKKASLGCKGSAARFIKSMKVMMKVGLYMEDAISISISLANTTDEKAETFFQVFQKSYLKNYLDLDTQSSVQLATELSLRYAGSSKKAKKDFDQFVEFCLDKESLGLSIPTCADFSLRMTNYGENKEAAVYPSFVRVFRFLKSKDGPEQSTSFALQFAEELVKIHPLAADDYIAAYKYAVKQEGLGLDKESALQLAKTLSQRTKQRIPANQEN